MPGPPPQDRNGRRAGCRSDRWCHHPLMPPEKISPTTAASAAGTWSLGDLTVNRIGYGTMRLTENADGTPSTATGPSPSCAGRSNWA